MELNCNNKLYVSVRKKVAKFRAYIEEKEIVGAGCAWNGRQLLKYGDHNFIASLCFINFLKKKNR